MSIYKTEELEYDNIDLGQIKTNRKPWCFYKQGGSSAKLPQIRHEKEEIRKSAERDRAMKHLRNINSKLEYWLAKRQFTVQLIKECEKSLQKLDIAVMSEITTR